MRNCKNIFFNEKLNIMFNTIVILFLVVSVAGGDVSSDTKKSEYVQNTFNKVRVEGFYQFGGALKNIILGSSSNSEGKTVDVRIGGGGGEGGGITMGYIFKNSYEFNAGVFLKKSHLIPTTLTNVTGSFTRTVIMGTIKYVLPITNLGALKFGAGAGYYIPGELDIDLSKTPDGDHIVCNYNNAVGIHLISEYEHLFRWWACKSCVFGLNLGIKYYNVSYAVNTSKVNNENVTLVDHRFNDFNGSGIDMYGSISVYIK